MIEGSDTSIALELPANVLDALADRIATRLQARLDPTEHASPWLTAREAAEHLRCPLSRVRKLTAAGVLPVHRDGGRVLYRADELDRFLATDRHAGPSCPARR